MREKVLNSKRLMSFFFVLYSVNAAAFNFNKCKRIIPTGNGAGIFLSTTSFFSSTGECAMIGEAEHDKKVYFVHNFDKMLEDFAKGNGEYAQSFAKMHGCSAIAQKAYPQIMKKNLNVLIQFDSTETSKKTYELLEKYFYNTSMLREECKIGGA
jgi:hypothetical protein